jgi:hypothetical protein
MVTWPSRTMTGTLRWFWLKASISRSRCGSRVTS